MLGDEFQQDEMLDVRTIVPSLVWRSYVRRLRASSSR